MLITCIGHGTTSVITSDVHLIIDPVFTRSMMGGIGEPAPARELDFDAMPKPDVVLVTHFHAGHLEPESLAMLSRETMVVYPADSTIELVLKRLGFNQRQAVSAGDRVDVGETRLTFTGTGQAFPYVGVHVYDGDSSFWYAGDRGDTLPRGELDKLIDQLGRPDVLVTSHPSDFHSFLLHGHFADGADEQETHLAWLQRTLNFVNWVHPKLALPQTTSFAYIGSAAWMNNVMFPMIPGEFSRIGSALSSEVGFDELGPGDAVNIAQGYPAMHRHMAPFVTSKPADRSRRWEPLTAIPPVRDSNPTALSKPELAAAVEEYIRLSLVPWLEGPVGAYRSLIESYRSNQITYRLSVVFPDDDVVTYRIRLEPTSVVVGVETDEWKSGGYSELSTHISASSLVRWAKDEIPYFVAASECRRSGFVTDLALAKNGDVVVGQLMARCLVSAHLMSDRSHLEQWLEREIQRLSSQQLAAVEA